MRRLLCVLLLAPALAWANFVVYDDTPAPAAVAAASGAASLPPLAQIQAAPPQPVWAAAAGSTLRDTLTVWAKRAHWTLVWDATVDYPIEAPVRFQGHLDQAVAQFIRLYAQSAQPLAVDVQLEQHLLYISNRKP